MGFFDPFHVGKGIHSMINPEEGYEDAAEQFKKYWEEAKGFQQPYNQAGINQLPMLQGAESDLLHPTELLGKWMKDYQTSPFAQRSMENAKASGLGAASSMGLGGSSAALGNIQQGAGDIMNKDRQGYLQDLMQKYMGGVGIGQDIYGKGAATAGNLGEQAGKMGNNMGGAAFGAASAPGEMMKNLMAMAIKAYLGRGGDGAGAGGGGAA